MKVCKCLKLYQTLSIKRFFIEENKRMKLLSAGKYTPQYKWLVKELPKVNRTETPWLIVFMHCPLYSSYVHHYMEGETMRVIYEEWFVQYKVDVVFAGHVHAYERSVSAKSPLHYSCFILLKIPSHCAEVSSIESFKSEKAQSFFSTKVPFFCPVFSFVIGKSH